MSESELQRELQHPAIRERVLLPRASSLANNSNPSGTAGTQEVCHLDVA